MNSTGLIVLACAILIRPAIRLLVEGKSERRFSDRELISSGIYTLIGVLCLIIGLIKTYGGGGSILAGLLILGVPALGALLHPGLDESPRERPGFFLVVLIFLLGCLSLTGGLFAFMFGY